MKFFDTAIVRAEIDTEGRALTPHSLRHNANSILREAGVNPDKIRASLGWSSEAIQNRYTHWTPEHLEDLGNVIETQIGQLGG